MQENAQHKMRDLMLESAKIEGSGDYKKYYAAINKYIGSGSSEDFAKDLASKGKFTLKDVEKLVSNSFGPNITSQVVAEFKKQKLAEGTMAEADEAAFRKSAETTAKNLLTYSKQFAKSYKTATPEAIMEDLDWIRYALQGTIDNMKRHLR